MDQHHSNTSLLCAAGLLVTLQAAACRREPPTSGLDVQVLDGNAVLFEFSGSDGEQAVVSFGVDGQYDQSLDLQSGIVSRPVVGLPPSTTVDYQLELTENGASVVAATGSFSTVQAPSALPDVEPVFEALDGAHEGLLVGSVMGSAHGPVIMDTEGQYVWWHLEEREEILCTSATLSNDGSSIIYTVYPAVARGGDAEDAYELVVVPLDGSPLIRHDAPSIHHDFVELPDGTLTYLGREANDLGAPDVMADTIMEIAPDGTHTQVFSAWDELAVENEDWEFDEGYGWTHGNAIVYDELEDVYYVSFRALSAIVKIARSSGEILWQLGGDATDFVILGTPFSFQHNFQLLDDGILIFDNTVAAVGASRVVQYTLDFDDFVAREVWSYTPEPNLWVASLGNVIRQPDGNTQVVWGQAAQFDEVDADGNLLLRLQTGLGSVWGYHRWLGTLQDLNPQLN